MTEESLFQQALDLSPEQRAAFLDRECRDPALRARVEALLAADAAAQSRLGSPPSEPSLDRTRTVAHEPQPQPETVAVGRQRSTDAIEPFVSAPIADTPAGAPSIPGYRILAEIAKGGMGCVYAGHDLTLEREVAIKTLLPGANAERFIVEAKITAKLPHPNIPPVYALGTLDDGTPWLAMKYIRGQTLAKLLQSRDRDPSRDRDEFDLSRDRKGADQPSPPAPLPLGEGSRGEGIDRTAAGTAHRER